MSVRKGRQSPGGMEKLPKGVWVDKQERWLKKTQGAVTMMGLTDRILP